MSNKTIKVVKREDRKKRAKAARLKKTKPEDPTRKAVQTVSDWVREFKEKGNTEANRVLAVLFEKPRPSEA